MNMSAISFRAAMATTSLVVKPNARHVKVRAGLKIYARMTKDRVSSKKDSKWRGDIDIYPVRQSICLPYRARAPIDALKR
jgi:light-harvesting complex I chlorophyll a/b binding protein 1